MSSIPSSMTAVTHNAAGCPASELSLRTVPTPVPRPGEILLKIGSTAVNRADIVQRNGKYPPPPGASGILGLEAAGVVMVAAQPPHPNSGAGAPRRFSVGDRVMCLLAGGGYAQYATVPERHCLRVPSAFSMAQAGALPEAWLTAFQLLSLVRSGSGGLWTAAAPASGDTSLLVHAGASGVGTAAIQLARHVFGVAKVFALVGNDDKATLVERLGAIAINRKEVGEFSARILDATGGKGVSAVLDCVGGSAWAQNSASLAMDGQWVVFGLLGGPRVEGELLSVVLRKRLRMIGSTLRGRTDEYKAVLIERFAAECLPLFENGTLEPILDREFGLSAVSDGHQYVEENRNLGKVVLKVQDIDAVGKDEF